MEKLEERQQKKVNDKAIDHLEDHVPVVKENDTIEDIINNIRKFDYNYYEFVYVIDSKGNLCGYLNASDIIHCPKERLAKDEMNPDIPMVYPDDDQEKVASLAIKHQKAAIPVIERSGKLLGVIPALAIIKILREEHIEDLNLLAGIYEKNEQAQKAISLNPKESAKGRLPYLLIGLAGTLIATFVMSQFEEVLATHIALAFFIPGLVYLSDAIGTQTFTVVIRGLSLNQPKFMKMLVKELLTGVIIGVILGALVFPFIYFSFNDIELAATVSLTLVGAGTVATTIGLLLPWILHKLDKDPALGSGPLATILVDIVSLVIFFVIAQMIIL